MKPLLKKAAFRLLSNIPGGARNAWTILAYHRIVKDTALPEATFPDLVVSQSTFRAALDWLLEHATVVSLEDGLSRISEAPGPREKTGPLVSITFDDCYKDNLTIACHELAARNLTATFFIATDYLDGADIFWWDMAELWAAVKNKPFKEVHRSLFSLSEVERRVRVSEMKENLHTISPPAGYLSSNDVRHMAGMGMSIGNHSASHPYLDQLGAEEQTSEITRAHERLSGIVGTPIRHFSYPNGRVSPSIDDTLSSLGYLTALTTTRGRNSHRTHHYRLRRTDAVYIEEDHRFSPVRARFWIQSGASFLAGRKPAP